MKLTNLAFAILAVAAAPLTVHAANPGSPASVAGAAGAETALEGPDTKFIAEAIQGGMAEVDLGKLALGKASGADVKKFAQRMVDDHSAANQQLQAMADKFQIDKEGTYGTPPLNLPAQAQAAHDELAKLSGREFDQAFMRQMVDDHQSAVALFKVETTDGKNAEVRGFAEATLPKLEEHLTMAGSLYKQVQASL